MVLDLDGFILVKALLIVFLGAVVGTCILVLRTDLADDVADAPFCSIGLLSRGSWLVRGSVEAVEPLLLSPLTGAACVAYRVRIRSASVPDDFTDQKYCIFDVFDGTGRIKISHVDGLLYARRNTAWLLDLPPAMRKILDFHGVAWSRIDAALIIEEVLLAGDTLRAKVNVTHEEPNLSYAVTELDARMFDIEDVLLARPRRMITAIAFAALLLLVALLVLL